MQQKKIRKILLIVVLISISYSTFSQLSDSTKVIKYFSGSVLITNKGISTIPNFTLGKPATILNFTFGKKIRFEPELRFALEGKPWMFIFWWRTELLKSEKFAVRIGANPTIAFKSMSLAVNGIQNDRLLTYRTLTADLTPTLSLNKKKFPFSIATMINRPIQTDITIGNKLIWNASLIYAFSNTYVKK